MAIDYRTAEARSFHEHYDKLVDSIQEPDLPVLGARFFSRQIISKETMEVVGNVTTSRAVRTSKLMLAVMAGLEAGPDRFESALDVFQEEQLYADLSSLLRETASKLKKGYKFLRIYFRVKHVMLSYLSCFITFITAMGH